jgi:hypothetical protein
MESIFLINYNKKIIIKVYDGTPFWTLKNMETRISQSSRVDGSKKYDYRENEEMTKKMLEKFESKKDYFSLLF